MTQFLVSRNSFSLGVVLGLIAGCLPDGMAAPATAPVLPMGSAPVPLGADWFPSRLHAFVWRNWSLVSPERLAKTVGAARAPDRFGCWQLHRA